MVVISNHIPVPVVVIEIHEKDVEGIGTSFQSELVDPPKADIHYTVAISYRTSLTFHILKTGSPYS